MDDIIENLLKLNLGRYLTQGFWGLEKESNRCDNKGNLALTPHPEKLGDKLDHPYITTDFSESQIEIITPPKSSIEEAYYLLENLHDIVLENLNDDEYIWPGSMPPKVPEESSIPIADYGESNEASELMDYREYIAEKYGRYKQLICGIHYNFSFTEEFFTKLYREYKNDLSFRTFKDRLYLKITRNLLNRQWILTYLLGGNVAIHDSFLNCCNPDNYIKVDEENLYPEACSFRNSLCGYRNKEEFRVSFDTIDEHIHDIKHLINTGMLRAVKEFYNPVRLKNSEDGNSTHFLEQNGIEYLELRMIDLNPITKTGIVKDDLILIHLILLGSLLDDKSSYTFQDQLDALQKQNETSLHGRDLNPELRDEGLRFFEKLEKNLKTLSIYSEEYANIINKAKLRLNGKLPLYSDLIYEDVSNEGYINHHLKTAKTVKERALAEKFSLKGYEDMELSTQILIKEALLKGLKVEILDRKENFISVSDGEKKEYIKQATKTSLDSYSTALVMENKAITKKILDSHGVKVPAGGIFTNMNSALVEFENFKDKKIVIKPNNTNFGTGITILNGGFTLKEFETGLNFAFKYDSTILIEEFIEGSEFRFTVIDGEVAGILQRVPANVTGDGKSTIKELVEIKNRDPLRGSGYKKPLELLKLGEDELILLKNLGMDENTIPETGHTVYLRENSNISTGGDSIDFTDKISDTYKEVAIKAAEAVGAKITGVDMMIGENSFGIIELNFNPAIHIHCHPYKGDNRRLGKKVLEALGF